MGDGRGFSVTWGRQPRGAWNVEADASQHTGLSHRRISME
jgi:hypothetical protein